MYKRALTGVLIILLAGFLFSSVFSLFSSNFQSYTQSVSGAVGSSILAY